MQIKKKKKFDIIIIGCGLSGIALALELLNKTKKKILILEKKEKLAKDKNWCFWNVPTNPFTHKYENRWNKILIKKGSEVITKEKKGFYYNHLSSEKLYREIIWLQKNSKNIKILFNQNISSIKEHHKFVEIRSNEQVFHGELLFDSRPPRIEEGKLVQHFYGIELKSSKSVFDKKEVILMDFIKKNNGIHFFYILPFSENEALIETTYFSKEIYDNKKYINDINCYLNEKFKGIRFTKVSNENGVIPMYDVINNNKSKRVIKIGTSNNWVKKSSGYAFQNSFINSRIIVEQIINNKKINVQKRWISILLDKIFCIFLEKFPHESPNLFINFFSKLDLEIIIKFLTDTSNFSETAKVIFALPKFKLLYCSLFLLKK